MAIHRKASGSIDRANPVKLLMATMRHFYFAKTMFTLPVLGWLTLAGSLCGCGDQRQVSDCRVQYRVTGTAPAAQVQYRLPQGSIEERAVSPPFTTGTYWFHVGTPASIEARNTGASGDLRVEILIEGQPDPLLHSRPAPGPYTTDPCGIVKASCLIGAK